jgi:hypothetical protein
VSRRCFRVGLRPVGVSPVRVPFTQASQREQLGCRSELVGARRQVAFDVGRNRDVPCTPFIVPWAVRCDRSHGPADHAWSASTGTRVAPTTRRRRRVGRRARSDRCPMSKLQTRPSARQPRGATRTPVSVRIKGGLPSVSSGGQRRIYVRLREFMDSLVVLLLLRPPMARVPNCCGPSLRPWISTFSPSLAAASPQ